MTAPGGPALRKARRRRSVWLAGWVVAAGCLGLLWAWPGAPNARARNPERDRPGAGSPRGTAASPAASPAPAAEASREAPAEGSPDVVRALVMALVSGPDDGVPAFLRVVALTAAGRRDRTAVSLALLTFLLEDVARPRPELSNPRATAMALLADRFPAPEVAERAGRYKRIRAGGAPLRAHAEVHARLAGWPPGAAEVVGMRRRIAELEARVAARLEAPDARARARRMLDELLQTGRLADRSVALEVVAGWLAKGGRESLIGVAVDAVLGHGDERGAALEILAMTESVQAASGTDERAHTGAMMLGMDLVIRLRALVAPEEWPLERRARILDLFSTIQAGPESLGAAVTQAVVLSGATDGDAVAVAKLADLFQTSVHRTVRETALVNLGSVVDLRTFLARTGATIDLEVSDEAAMLQQATLLGAFSNILIRHPEDAPALVDLYRLALARWRTDTPPGRVLVADVLRYVARIKVAGSRELLEDLARSPNAFLAGRARAELEKTR